MLMKDSTAVSNQWCMPVNFLGGATLFDPWFTQYMVKGHLVQICKKKKNQRDYAKEKSSDKNQLELGKGVGLMPKIYIYFIQWSNRKIISFVFAYS